MNLLVPEHVALLQNRLKEEKAKAEALAKAAEAKSSPDELPPTHSAYVPKAQVVLDPTKLPKNIVDRLPQPTGWRVLLLPYQGKKTTAGGVYIPDQVIDREALATVCGYVLKVGPEAYKGDKFASGPWCKPGDWVIFGRYAGARFRIEGGEVRMLNDDEILATIVDPDDIVHI